MATSYRIAVVDDESANLESLDRILRSDGAEVSLFVEPREALKQVAKESFDILLTDLKMGSMSGLELLESVRLVDNTIEVILITAFGTVELAVEAMKKGAYDFITKPLTRVQVIKCVHKALEKKQLIMENSSLRNELNSNLRRGSGELTGTSDAYTAMMDLTKQAANSRANVLIDGESGTGKGVLAEHLHRTGTGELGVLVKINCTSIPENLLEAELFGHETGAFTGAVRRRKGRVEISNKGTLFLDEIGCTPLSFQSKLLRFVQEGEFERLGSNETLKVQTRVVSATNADLKRAILAGTFREDLYYRLNVIHIHVPSLRERRIDIPILAQHFLIRSAKKNGREIPLLHRDVVDLLTRYPWPGNIRELENLMERLVVLNRSGVIQTEDLPPEFGQGKVSTSVQVPIGLPLKEVEKILMEETLKSTRGDKKLAARLLGVHPRTIYRHLEVQDPAASEG